MINDVFIILESGTMIFNHSFRENAPHFDSKHFLLSGFFTAISHLAIQALEDNLKEITLQNQKIIFKL